jgi:hypothetical protein
VRAVRVVVAAIRLEHKFELAAADDQEPVEALASERAYPPFAYAFAFGARIGVRMTLMPSLWRMASKAPLNLLSRSWIRKRKRLASVSNGHE